MRGINERFISDLTVGSLSCFMNRILTCNRLCLEIRDSYINIYYRGGNVLRIRQRKNDYRFEFDEKYCLNEKSRTQVKVFHSLSDYQDNFGLLLFEMDNWFCKHPKKEREIQHNLIKCNTDDFCVIDIEYAGKDFRFDMIAVHDGKLIIVENKNGETAMGGKSGVAKHYKTMCDVIDSDILREDLLNSMRNIVANKKSLGLPAVEITSDEIDILFLVFNPNAKSKMLDKEKAKINKRYPAKIIFMDNSDGEIQYALAQILV